MSDTPGQSFLSLFRAALDDGSFARLVLARPRAAADADLLKVSARPLRLKDRVVVSFVETHRTRDLTRNLAFDDAVAAASGWLAANFNQAHLFTNAGGEVQLLISKRGRQTLLRGKQRSSAESSAGDPKHAEAAALEDVGDGHGGIATMPALAAHDRVKRRPIDLARPFLKALGVTDAGSRLIPTMARKWKQINKFVEVLDHALTQTSLGDVGAAVEVLDFGSGKGYLTFATHDHLRHTLGLPARVTGVDLKADMIELCNRAAAEVGAEGLAFELGDVSSRAPQRADVMIALHACDTATDHAIHAGLRAGAAIIMCSPCCHKELRPQLLSPHPLRPILKHGVHLGQQAEMLTDGLRALLLEARGYDTQVFEFVSPEQTSKNKMILAVRKPAGLAATTPDAVESLWQQVDELKAFYGIRTQCLETLLRADRLPSAPMTSPPRKDDKATPSPAALSRTARS